MLKSCRRVDLKIFGSLSDEEYPYLKEWQAEAAAGDEEVLQYLCHDKWGYKQEQLDFESDEPVEAVMLEDIALKPRRKRSKSKALEVDEDVMVEAVWLIIIIWSSLTARPSIQL